MMNDDSTVSVVILAKNCEHLMEKCLESVLQNKPFELVVVDGVSTDRTREISREMGAVVVKVKDFHTRGSLE